MNKLTIKLFFGLLIVISSTALMAQKEWTLEECINYAIENNIEIRKSVINVETADDNLLQSKLNLLPSVNGSMSQSYNWGRNLDPQTNLYVTQQTDNTGFGLSSDITLFNGLQQINTIRKTQFDYLATKYASDKIRNDMSLNVAAGYLQILFNIELVNNAERQVQTSKEQIDRTNKQVEAGAVARGSLYDIQAQGASEEANLVTAQNRLMLAYLDLMQLLDLEANAEFDIQKPELNITGKPTLLPAETIYNKSITLMPEIKSAEYLLLSAERSLAIAKGMRSPRLFASGSYGTGYSRQILEITGYTPAGIPIFGDTKPFNDQFKDNRNGNVYMGISIPIFNGFQVSTNINQSKMYQETVELNLQSEKLLLRKNIESAHADAIGAYQTYLARKKSVEAFREAFKYTEEKFDVGMVNSTDYNVAKIQLANAESDLASAKFDYIFKTKILDFYLGKSMTLTDIANVEVN
jgi:outer membrane protein